MNDPIYMAGPDITQHEVETVMDALRDGWYGERAYHYVETFQREFAKFHDRKHALMTPNCTAALHLLLTALGIKQGDEVIVPELTWIATAAPVSYLNATPVFCDIDPVNWCLDPDSVGQAITPKTKAIIAVDLYGNMPLMDELGAIAGRYGIPLIEDAAQALGSVYQGTRAGKFGVGSVFSFHRTKTVVTGEGGMLVLDDDALAERCSLLRDHGRSAAGPMYYNYEVAYKYMPSNLQAALGYAQFQRLQELVEKKRWIWKAYKERLQDIENLDFNAEPEGVYNSVWITGLLFGISHRLNKLEAMKKMQMLGLPTRPFFYPLSSLPAYPGKEPYYRNRNPRAYDIGSRGINLPGAFTVNETQIDRICDGVRMILSNALSRS